MSYNLHTINAEFDEFIHVGKHHYDPDIEHWHHPRSSLLPFKGELLIRSLNPGFWQSLI